MDNPVLILNKEEHAEMVQKLDNTREFLISTINLIKEQESLLQELYERLMPIFEMSEESLKEINDVLFEITVP